MTSKKLKSLFALIIMALQLVSFDQAVARTYIQGWQVQINSPLSGSGLPSDQTLDSIVPRLDAASAQPLKLSAAVPANSSLVIGPSEVNKANSGGSSQGPAVAGAPVYAGATLNYQGISVTGGTIQFNGTPITTALPGCTVGQFYRHGFVYKAVANVVDSTISAGALSVAALPDVGLLFTALDGLVLGYVNLECTSSTGLYKTAGSATSIVENSVSGTPRIFNFEERVGTLAFQSRQNVNITGGQVNNVSINAATLSNTNGTLVAPIIDDGLFVNAETSVATPPAGRVAVYAKNDNKLYQKDNTGLEKPLGSGAGAGEKNYVQNPDDANAGWAVVSGATLATTNVLSNLPEESTKTTAISISGIGSVRNTQITLDSTDLNKNLKVSFAAKYAGSLSEYSVEVYSYTDAARTLGQVSLPLMTYLRGLENQLTFTSSSSPYLELVFVKTAATPLYLSGVLVGPGQFQGAFGDASPLAAGSIQAFAGGTVPQGWMLCDGTAIAIVDYPQLYARIGTIYNTQINPTTQVAYPAPAAGFFRVPDYRSLFLRGAGTNNYGVVSTLGVRQTDATARNGLNNVASGVTGTTNIGHTHAASSISGTAAASLISARVRGGTGGGANLTVMDNTGSILNTNNIEGSSHTHSVSGTAAGQTLGTTNVALAGGTAAAQNMTSTDAETRPQAQVVNYIIKVYDAAVVPIGPGSTVEFVADDGTNAVFGPNGAPVPNVAVGTGTTIRSFNFSSPQDTTALYVLEMNHEGNGWTDSSLYPLFVSSTHTFGMAGRWTSPTQYDVIFGNGGVYPNGANITSNGANPWAGRFSAGTRFRVRRTSAASAAGIQTAGANNAGTISSEDSGIITGTTTGVLSVPFQVKYSRVGKTVTIEVRITNGIPTAGNTVNISLAGLPVGVQRTTLEEIRTFCSANASGNIATRLVSLVGNNLLIYGGENAAAWSSAVNTNFQNFTISYVQL